MFLRPYFLAVKVDLLTLMRQNYIPMKTVLFLVIFSIFGIGITYYYLQPKEEKVLPIINPIDVSPEMVEQDLLRIGYGHEIQRFKMTDQHGKTFDSQILKGKVYVVEYFFTTCGTICPIMNTQMQRVQKAYKSNTHVAIVSFTVDPEHDTSEVLLSYAKKHHADPSKWHFLTGSKMEIYNLARRSFFLLKPAEAINQGDIGSDFIHTNNFVLIDQHGRIRGYYDGTAYQEVTSLIQDVELLLKETN